MPSKVYDDFTRGYMGCALWAETDDAGQPLDSRFDVCDIAPDCVNRMDADCAAFQTANAKLLKLWYATGETEERAGHDFWLTRNGHGAGFWDRFSDNTHAGKVGRLLTDKAHGFGECNLYVGDDELVHGGN